MHFFKATPTLLLIFFILSFCIRCVPVTQTGSAQSGSVSTDYLNNGVYEDWVLDSNVHTVQIHTGEEPIFGAAVPMNRTQSLYLSFDMLTWNNQGGDYTEYNFQIIHCNGDWRKSNLYDMDYLEDYNEFAITDESFSYNTRVPFTHYNVQLPRVKVPGNYAIQVYRGNNESDVVFIKRLMVFEPLVGVSAEITRSSSVSDRDIRHQLEFLVDYSKFNISNPFNDIYVVIRQNQQWFNAIKGLKPTFVREQDRQLEYRHFNLENTFYAGNEYRYFDIRTVSSFGQNVAEINKESTPVKAFLLPDRSRATEAYSQYQDLNGAYVIGNLETRGGPLNADYINTSFTLRTEELPNAEVYVMGAFNNKVLSEANRMRYDATLQSYTADLLLKQGFYNYLFYVQSGNNSNPYPFDGNYFQTDNQYEVLVYVRPIGSRGDLLVGYTNLSSSESGR